MKRTINIINNPENLNPWVRRSITLFGETSYLDNIQEIYPFQVSQHPQRINSRVRRAIIQAHQSRNTKKLLGLLESQIKFPYEDPVWYLLKKVRGCLANNPSQAQRIADSLYSMTAEETVIRLESPQKLNTQIGPMFRVWLKRTFNFLPLKQFQSSQSGVFVLEASEEVGKQFVENILRQVVAKRPDLIAKVNTQYIIGEAKWVGQPGGNQGKQVQEVLAFCKNQRGNVRRIGIVDGFPWAVYNRNEKLINSKEAVLIQESEYDILSALLLNDYFLQF